MTPTVTPCPDGANCRSETVEGRIARRHFDLRLTSGSCVAYYDVSTSEIVDGPRAGAVALENALSYTARDVHQAMVEQRIT